MNIEERQLLTSLFERVRTAATAPRDPEAEALIASAVREQPYSPYLLAQAVLLQEQALKAADTRLHALENQIATLEQAKVEQPAPGFLGGIGASVERPAACLPSARHRPPNRRPNRRPACGTNRGKRRNRNMRHPLPMHLSPLTPRNSRLVVASCKAR